jgi:hypothetical protein
VAQCSAQWPGLSPVTVVPFSPVNGSYPLFNMGTAPWRYFFCKKENTFPFQVCVVVTLVYSIWNHSVFGTGPSSSLKTHTDHTVLEIGCFRHRIKRRRRAAPTQLSPLEQAAVSQSQGIDHYLTASCRFWTAFMSGINFNAS